MSDPRRRDLLKAVAAAGAFGAVGTAAAVTRSGQERTTPVAQPERGPPVEYEDYAVHRVDGDGSADFERIQAAVTAAEPRDLILVEPGVYHESVEVLNTPRLTIRGTDRNEVILDGEFTRRNGVFATADEVVMENLTARHYEYNGFYWSGVDGYRGSYLTAYDNGDYGVYAFASVNGKFEHSYASGHPDSGFYVGQCDPCHAVLDDLVAERNGLGYSGTNAGGYLTIENSVWRHNRCGILPNTLDSEELAPQRGVRIEGNEVRSNANPDAPGRPLNVPAFGTGIAVAGGNENEIVDNVVEDHAYFGVVIAPMIDESLWTAGFNEVRGNEVSRSGRADLALGLPAGEGNCFADNDFASSRPANVEGRFGCDGKSLIGGLWSLIPGDLWPTLVMGRGAIQAELGSFPSGDWKSAPEPPDQPTMTDPERPPREAVGEVE